MENQTVVITGATGFIGIHLSRFLSDRGYSVRALVRNFEKGKAILPFSTGGLFCGDLPQEVDPKAFEGQVRAVIHCAYETRFKNVDQARAINQLGTEKILELTRKNSSAQFVFISSMAAHANAHSYYGKSKWELENKLDETKDLIIKPGTVLGNGGIFERTREMIRKLPVLPVFFGSHKKMQTVWIEDLCLGVAKALEKKLSGKFCIAEEEGVSILDFYRGIAALDGKNPWIVPFPGNFALFCTQCVEKLGVQLPITSENLLGIKFLNKFDVKKDLEQLEIRARSFSESLQLLAR